MSFLTLHLKKDYRSPENDVVQDFFNPVLSSAKIYKRSVGFFSSSSLIEITKGISELVNHNGKIQIVASPKLSIEDIEAIKLGYSKKAEIIERRLLNELEVTEEEYFAKERLNLLANLIASGTLSLKIAFTDNGKSVGIYHEKLGVFEDFEGNIIAFDGSMNESITAMRYNYESVNVFCEWVEADKERTEAKVKAFENIWNDADKALHVIDFPSVTQKILDKYKRHDLTDDDWNLDIKEEETMQAEYPNEQEEVTCKFSDSNPENDSSFFTITDGKTPRLYQKEAIKKFVDNNYQCLFAMATGTGKTLTSIFAANELAKNEELETVLILVPLKDLVDQWYKDISKYFSKTIIQIHSGIDWKEQVSFMSIQKILAKNSNEKFVVISTYESFSINKDKIVKLLNLKKTLLIADECHKTGAKTYRKNLPEEIPFRIGLSATPKRPYDEKGTKAIFEYFDPNENPFEFSIKDAIEQKMLCPYNYYPIFVELSIIEMDDYTEISERINKLTSILSNENSTDEDKEKLEQLLKQRHRIIERAENKFDLFTEKFIYELEKYQKYTIVFSPDGSDENNIDILTKYKDSVIKKAREKNIYLTTVEYIQGTDKKILEYFSKGQIDIVFAKQRLNEGIDIPSARRAFFISSSTSEREFIQRRGRVLRLCEGKEIAEIFDFIVVPPENAETFYDKKICTQIKESELKRAIDFAKTANNFNEITL